jgi:hypothetical protein
MRRVQRIYGDKCTRNRIGVIYHVKRRLDILEVNWCNFREEKVGETGQKLVKVLNECL